MIKFKKSAVFAAALSITILTSGLTASAKEVTVKMNAVGSERSEYMSFAAAQPIMYNDVLFVPARSLADSADMEVEWDQTTETALMTINLENGISSPIKQYANELINKVSGYGLELTPSAVSAAFTAESTDAVLRFIFKDTDGDEVAIGKTIALSYAPKVVNDTTMMLPLRDSAGVFGLDVEWSQEDLAVCISIPEFTIVPTNMKIVPVHTPIEKSEETIVAETVDESAPVEDNKGTYLGRFKITHYCPCSTCNGGWGNNTAYAGKIIPGQTIAVDPNVIPPLSWVYIDGYGLRRAEDCGGGIKNYHIDMAVSSHSEAYRLGVVYKDVWLQ
ncbi:MAG: stalk domain-containing protein [Clostridia bacterium]|nr:stalk domain-containing protein [Clostridia bacterium]